MPSSTDKSVNAEETVHNDAMENDQPVDAEEDLVNVADEQPQNDADLKKDNSTWITQPPKPETADLKWNKDPNVDDVPKQTWFNDLKKAAKVPSEFNDLMGSTIDFSNFVKHHLNKDKITKADLEGPVFKLLKGTYRSSIQLEYHLEQCYLAFSDQMDSTNLEDKKQEKEIHYIDYQDKGCKDKLFNLPGNDIIDLVIALRMFTRSLIINKRVEDVQLGVKSYQNKLNITKPHTTFDGLSFKEKYTTTYDLKGVVYLNKSKQKRLMQDDELYKHAKENMDRQGSDSNINYGEKDWQPTARETDHTELGRISWWSYPHGWYETNNLSKFNPDTKFVLYLLQDKLTSREKSLVLSAFKLSRLFFSLLSLGTSSWLEIVWGSTQAAHLEGNSLSDYSPSNLELLKDVYT
ncbi:hypothetical protein Tco_0144300 [Tanacetum coccineum]